jgi:hypothetical protein
VRRSVSTLINGLTAGAVASRSDWPAEKQVEQMRLQVSLLREWAAKGAATAAAKPRKERSSVA